MTDGVEVFYSLQSDYCYFLLDRLIALEENGVAVTIRPVLGGVLRLPERYKDRDDLEQRYFETDAKRTADFLGLAYAYPDPSPIEFEPDSLWVAKPKQSRNEYLNRLFVAASKGGRALSFLNHVGRMLWDGSTPNWDQGDHLAQAISEAGLDLTTALNTTPWSTAKSVLDENAKALIQSGHWGVPLMVLNGEPFYGQDRFDQLKWRLAQGGQNAV